jgi:predicted nucleic acid-binding Zn ribbon protein
MAQPRPIADVLSQLIARRGYARQQSTAALDVAWRQAAGEKLAKVTRAKSVRRGTLEVIVSNNLLAQELGFQKEELIARLTRLAADENISDIRFRIGQV